MGSIKIKEISTYYPYKHHMLAFAASIDSGASNTQVTAKTDGVFVINSGNFIPSNNINIYYAAGLASDACRLRIISPSLLLVGYPHIQPLSDANPSSLSFKMMDFREYPIRIPAGEILGVTASNTNESGRDIQVFMGVGANQTTLNLANKDLRWLRATMTVGNLANTWVAASLIFEDTLPSGTYAVYGLMAVESSGATTAVRLVFPGQVERPGTLISKETVLVNKIFQGGLGLFGGFSSYAPPYAESFSKTNSTRTVDVYLLLNKT